MAFIRFFMTVCSFNTEFIIVSQMNYQDVSAFAFEWFVLLAKYEVDTGLVISLCPNIKKKKKC